MSRIVRVFSNAARLQANPGPQVEISRRDSQLLYGEDFEVLRVGKGWLYGRSLLDHYTGWVDRSHVRTAKAETTHIITTLAANAYPEPNFKTSPSLTLSFLSRVTVDEKRQQGGFIALKGKPRLWIPASHLARIDDLAANPADIVETTMMFSGCPYLYGGRSVTGIDCSGMVQVALQRNGISCPRDCDQQEKAIGIEIALADLRRGDIVYFTGHVGIAVDKRNILNANARHMKVLIESLDDLIGHYGPPESVRRLVR